MQRKYEPVRRSGGAKPVPGEAVTPKTKTTVVVVDTDAALAQLADDVTEKTGPVPDKADDVIAWIDEVDGDEKSLRALAAGNAEEARSRPRKTVLEAVEAALDFEAPALQEAASSAVMGNLHVTADETDETDETDA